MIEKIFFIILLTALFDGLYVMCMLFFDIEFNEYKHFSFSMFCLILCIILLFIMVIVG